MVEQNKSPPHGGHAGMLHPNRSMFVYTVLTAGLAIGVGYPLAKHIYQQNQDIVGSETLKADEKATGKTGEAATWEAYIQQARRTRDARNGPAGAINEERIRTIVKEEIKGVATRDELDEIKTILLSTPQRSDQALSRKAPPLSNSK